MSRRRAALAVVLGAATWGTTGTSQALAGLTGTPQVVGAARVVFGALVLLALTSLDRGATVAWREIPRRPLLVSGAAIAAYQVLFFAGVAQAGVAVGTVVGIGSAPVLTGAVAWIADGHRPSRAWWGATALAVAGCALVLAPGGDETVSTVDPVGVLLAIGAGLAYAILTVASRRLLDAGVGPTRAMAAVFAVGALPGLVVFAVRDVEPLLTGPGLALVAWLALVTVGVGYAAYARGLAVLEPAAVGTLTLTEPLVAAVLGVVVLLETPGALAVSGAALLVLGLVLIAREGAGDAAGEVDPAPS